MSSLQEDDFVQVREKRRVNDRVINSYLELLKIRGTKKAWPSVFYLNTHFMEKLLRADVRETARWLKDEDIFKYEILLVPYFVPDLRHWVLLIADFRIKEIQVYDSLHGEYRDLASKLLEFMQYVALKIRGEVLLTRKWRIKDKLGPKQYNNYDCGIFLCLSAEAYAADRTIGYTQRDIQWLREVIAEELRARKILSHQKPLPEIPGVKPPPLKKGRRSIPRRTSPMFTGVRREDKGKSREKEVKVEKQVSKEEDTTAREKQVNFISEEKAREDDTKDEEAARKRSSARSSGKRYRSSSSSSSSSTSSTSRSSSNSSSSRTSTSSSSSQNPVVEKETEAPLKAPTEEPQQDKSNIQSELDNILSEIVQEELDSQENEGHGPSTSKTEELDNDWDFLVIPADGECPPTPGQSSVTTEEPRPEAKETINYVEVSQQVVNEALHQFTTNAAAEDERVIKIEDQDITVDVKVPLDFTSRKKADDGRISKNTQRRQKKHRKFRDRLTGSKFWKS